MSCRSSAGNAGNGKWQVSVHEHLPAIKPNIDCPSYLLPCSFLPPQHLQPWSTPALFLGLSHVDAHTDIGIFECLASRPVLSCPVLLWPRATPQLIPTRRHLGYFPDTRLPYARQTCQISVLKDLGQIPGVPRYLGRYLGGLVAKPSVIAP